MWFYSHLSMKRVFQMCLMLLVLLMQTVPLMALGTPGEEKCTMGCCAWLAEQGVSECGCFATPVKDSGDMPLPLPPATPGRESIPQAMWTELRQDFEVFVLPVKQAGRTIRPAADEQTRTMPRVRLSVLFCSFLT